MSSNGGLSRRPSRSSASKSSTKNSAGPRFNTPPPSTITPENLEAQFEPCAATASYLLYAQQKTILVLHHDTLAIERRFTGHAEVISWISVDNASERGPGRLAVSSDAGKTTVVWDILTGGEVARFSSYEHMLVANFMRNGNIAFGNDKGNIVLFEPSTSEHISARTIYDPITAIAPSADCRTFAIGYMNGSILIATLQPSFTILHTLTTTRAPSRITGLAWHGSSSKQKTDMLATQTMDGDLRVWSVPKAPSGEQPNIIRVLQRADVPSSGPCWFSWSKNGRIVQYAEGETRAWDVRTKKVSWDLIPTSNDVVGMASFGPAAALFTLSRSHIVQQFDITPNNVPLQVATVQHVPANTPPTPPTILEENKNPYTTAGAMADAPLLPSISDTGESSADENSYLSPIDKIAKEMDSLDAMQSELRDKVMPLSPTSSRASSASSRSSGARRRGRKYLYDRPESSRASTNSTYDHTEFSSGTASVQRPNHESISIRSVSSFASASNSRPRMASRPTNLRREVLRGPHETTDTAMMDLFPDTKARLRDVAFRTPHYGTAARTPDLLQREMLSVVFGWNDDAESLVRNEMANHRPGSASSVLLSKWLGDVGADNMASMVGSESMTSSDWMLLALSSIGADSQKKVGEAFVQRLLEKGDVHPAVAILLGLGEHDDAIEVYVSQQYWLEAVILTCIMCPSDWGRISYLIRKWGEAAVKQGQAELAVRCFSCTSIETSEPWFSPRAQDAVYTAAQERFTQPPSAGGMTSPPLSPPSRSASGRLTQKNASLRLITTFGEKGVPVGLEAATPIQYGVTPIAQSAMPSALSPGGIDPWSQRPRNMRDPSSTRTATPGGFSRRKRLPSRNDIERAKQEAANLTTPVTAAREYAPPLPAGHSRRTSSMGSSQEPATAVKTASHSDRLAPDTALRMEDRLPSPAQGTFDRLRESHNRHGSIERRPEGLAVQIMETRYSDHISPVPGTGSSRGGALTPSNASSTKGARSRASDKYISSIDAARDIAREKREKSRRRGDSRKREDGGGSIRPRDASATRGRDNVRYIKPAKRSPSSPVPMSPEEIALATHAAKAEPATTDDESFYKMTSPVDSHKSAPSLRSAPNLDRRRPSLASTTESAAAAPSTKVQSRGPSRQPSPDGNRLRTDSFRGRSEQRIAGSSARSPSSPLPAASQSQDSPEQDETNSDGRRVRLRAGSRAEQSHRERSSSRNWRERSTSRKPPVDDESTLGLATSHLTSASYVSSVLGSDLSHGRGLSRKQIAAKELEERRLSLARRPSAPSIPLPAEFALGAPRPVLGPRSNTELGNSPTSNTPPFFRSQTVDPDAMSRYGRLTGTSTPSMPIGLPATPRAMRHPRYLGSEGNKGDFTPPVPEIPDNASQLSSLGSNLSHMMGSAVESNLTSNVTSNVMSHMSSNVSHLTSSSGHLTANTSVVTSNMSQLSSSELDDNIAPLLPSTVFGQKIAPPTSRSASAPPEHMYQQNISASNRRLSHVRKISPPEATHAVVPAPQVTSIDEALASSAEQQIIIIPEAREDPPMLPELQHLSGPPPPPPPPTMFSPQYGNHLPGSGVISVAMDEGAPDSAIEAPMTLPSTTYPYAMERAATTSPTAHRRGRGSVSEGLGSRFRGFGERMRSTSRNNAKSPVEYTPSPYETVLPPFPLRHQRGASIGRAQSPYEQAMAAQNSGYQEQIPPPPPPPSAPPIQGADARITETTIPPNPLSRSASAMSGYRNPKEIRANMPPSTIQQGVQGGFL